MKNIKVFFYMFILVFFAPGLAVAEELGGLRRPWNVKNESGRIKLLKPIALEAAE